jgi:hypothetical protein
MTTDDKKAIADLKVEVDQLKASIAPTPNNDAAAVGAWRDEQHKIAEARASITGLSRADLAEFERACPTSTMRSIVHDNRGPSGPSSQGVIPSSQQMSNVRTGGGPRGTGWQREVPIGPPPGIHHIDRLMLHDDIEFRRQRIAEAQALKAATEDKPK